MIRSKPCSAKIRAKAVPIPADAPVISAVRRAVSGRDVCGAVTDGGGALTRSLSHGPTLERGDLGGGPEAAFDRPVRVALPPHTGVFAGAQDAAVRSREPRTQVRVTTPLKIRIAAACPRILFPGRDVMRHHARLSNTEPVQLAHDPFDAAPRQQLTGRRARRTSGEQREDASRTFLLFIAIPDGANREIGPVSASRSGLASGRVFELQ